MAAGIKPEHIAIHLQRAHAAGSPLKARGPVDGDPGEEPPASPRPIVMKELLAGAHHRGPLDAEASAIFICQMQSILCRAMASHLRSIVKAYPLSLRVIVHPLFDH